MAAPLLMIEVKNKLDLSSASLGNLPTGANAALPDPNLVRALYLLCFSFLISAFTMYIVILSLGWLRRYAEPDYRTNGSIVDAVRVQQCKMIAMVTWRFDLVMRCLSLVPGVGFFLLSYGFYDCFPFIDKAVVSRSLGFSAFISFLVFITTSTSNP